MKFSSTSNTKVQSCLYPLFQNQCPHFLLSALFWKLFSENYLNPQVRINKMVNKHTVDYHPSPSQIPARVHPFIFLWTQEGVYLSRIFLEFFLNLYIPPFHSKKWICLFYLMHPSKTLPQVFIITRQAEGDYPFLPNSIFWIFIF